ncbi:hypothetical protein BDZ94DRAFT_1151843 [Collybia nuda]|uniref:RNI-like protein n=1 Tax=Collybia nuda TaxID=64659 RepID=A0A9P5YJI2_9AGAR|nr:hypothetical protein BDZ94DRAFT_1151843 [Collybia nuda]
MSRIKLKLSSNRVSGNLTKIFLFRKHPETITKSLDGPLLTHTRAIVPGVPTCHSAFKVNDLDSSAPQFLDHNIRDIASQYPDAFYYKFNPPKLKHKGRSHSSPFPISALDYVPVTSKDIFTPIPLIIRNYFDDVIPKETRLQILLSLVDLHETEFIRSVDDGRWTVAKASSLRGRYTGRDKGIRELFKLSRVSKAWLRLVFDGQLWHDLDLHAFPNIPEPLLARLTSTGGSFTTRLDVAGHAQLMPTVFLGMIDNLCLPPSPSGSILTNTQLTAINLQGCSGLTSLSLHYVLVRSPSLRRLCLKGLRAVTNTTCDIISTYCPRLTHLDVSRCSNMNAKGILRMSSSAIDRCEHLYLIELRLCGLKNMDDAVMSALGKAAPYLEVLDLSYVRQLHNSAVEAFIACESDSSEDLGVDIILVSPRDIGRESNHMTKCRRRVTRLRHLSLSSCILLTDDACSNLAHSVPQLEYLELAGIGAALKDDGLIRLLNTTRLIRRLDLEDASAISDSLIATITPSINPDLPLNHSVRFALEPGHALEQLNISYATHISDDAMLVLIHNCMRLKWLEADNTHISSRVIKEFVQINRERGMIGAKIVAIDCRGISEPFVREISASTRPRRGWRAHQARKLMYLDARDKNVDDLKVGQDECDERRIVMKSFYSWQTVDAVKSAREKRRKANSRRAANESGGSFDLDDRVTKWWSPGGRRSPRTGRNSPLDPNSEGCAVM